MSVDRETPGVLVLAHLGWDNVWQRPQHILSRLGQSYPVLYVNEPRVGQLVDGPPHLEMVAEQGGVCAWQPIFPDTKLVLERWRQEYLQLVESLLLAHGWLRRAGGKLVAARPLIAWFYTPVPHYFLDHLPIDVVVYDIMDELSNFKGAGADLKEREARLLGRADVVFAGGRSMYEARLGTHPNLHLFASGVDPAHFRQALDPRTPIAAEIRDLPHPVLGYYGVVDERLDLDLLRTVGTARPDWSIVVVGPVAKIEEKDLPRLPNVYYLGQQPYERLPHLLKGFDVCLMPFAMNDATRYISPTKTLEYMAAHKRIVSTPVPDVVRNWGHVVYVADGAAAFAGAVERALAETEAATARRAAAEREILARNDWDQIAGDMRRLIERAMPSANGALAVPGELRHAR